MTTKTYTTKSNLRRALKKAGVEINEDFIVKQADGRFSYEVPEMTPQTSVKEIKRPKAGGLCAAVWAHLDKKGNITLQEMKATAEKKGWNVNNATIELYQWRKFNGIASHKKAA
jgi:hypothetical protein